jgi:tetrahydromethanopterin S-methyltransferase subunit E
MKHILFIHKVTPVAKSASLTFTSAVMLSPLAAMVSSVNLNACIQKMLSNVTKRYGVPKYHCNFKHPIVLEVMHENFFARLMEL